MTSDLVDADYRRLLDVRDGLRRFLHWSEQQAVAAGLTAAQHQLLLAIRGHPGPHAPTIGDVAGHLLLRHHSAVGLVDRTVAAGLVERVPDRLDHRVVRLRLTPVGSRRLASLAALHLEEIDRLTTPGARLWAGLGADHGVSAFVSPVPAGPVSRP